MKDKTLYNVTINGLDCIVRAPDIRAIRAFALDQVGFAVRKATAEDVLDMARLGGEHIELPEVGEKADPEQVADEDKKDLAA